MKKLYYIQKMEYNIIKNYKDTCIDDDSKRLQSAYYV